MLNLISPKLSRIRPSEILARVSIVEFDYKIIAAHVELSRLVGYHHDLTAFLSADEKHHVATIDSAQKAMLYLCSRALTRLLCQTYYGHIPTSIKKHRSGTPSLVFSDQTTDQYLSYSYTDGVMGIALSQTYPIGLDIEKNLLRTEAVKVFNRFGSKEEKKALLGGEFQLNADTFNLWWTRKEAVAKSLGLGLGMDFRTVTVLSNQQLDTWQPVHSNDRGRNRLLMHSTVPMNGRMTLSLCVALA